MRYQQCHLRSGNSYLTCLLEAGRVKVGNIVTLKDFIEPERRWEVLATGVTVGPAFVHRTWENNI